MQSSALPTMSEFSYDRAKVPAFTSDFNPGHQLPARPFVVQRQPQTDRPANASQDLARMQQLDAGVMRALNLQAKLAIGAPGDKYEQEADAVAAQVVDRIHAPQMQQKPIQRQDLPDEDELQMKPLVTQTLQRQDLPDEDELQMKPLARVIQRQDLPEEDELQMKPLPQTLQRQDLPEEDEDLQLKPLIQRRVEAEGTAPADLESSLAAARGQGRPLGDEVQGPMEQAFGADFSGVRVHTGSQSAQLNQSIQARAFTTGQDIFFRPGEYQPGNRSGQELLAHELTHVVQQNGSAVQPKEQRPY